MTGRILRMPTDRSMISSGPVFEVRIVRHGAADTEIEIWQMPSAASPRLSAPVRIAGLRGRNLELVEHRVLKLLAASGVRVGTGLDRRQAQVLPEDQALRIGLLFRTLAPMRSRENMRAVADGIETMGREEAAYWLGMAMHRKNPRRVLTALRFLLTDPQRRESSR